MGLVYGILVLCLLCFLVLSVRTFVRLFQHLFRLKKRIAQNHWREQECIPVGYVSSAAVAVGCVCVGGCIPACNGQDGGVYPSVHWAEGCIPACTGQEVSAWWSVCPSACWDTPLDRIFDTRLWKYCLSATTLRTVIKSCRCCKKT